MRAGVTRAVRTRSFFVLVIALLSVAAMSGQTPTGVGHGPLPAYRFSVMVEGVDVGFFRSVSGLALETEVIEYQDGGSNTIRKLPGARKFQNITLKRGFTGNTALYDWYLSSTKPNATRVNGSIVMFDLVGNELARWQFHNAFPAKWEGPELDASGNEVPIESIELAHDGLTMSKDDDRQ